MVSMGRSLIPGGSVSPSFCKTMWAIQRLLFWSSSCVVGVTTSERSDELEVSSCDVLSRLSELVEVFFLFFFSVTSEEYE